MSVRKDVEKAFGVVQAKFQTVSRASCLWMDTTMAVTMKCCIILHNMAVEYRERNQVSDCALSSGWNQEGGLERLVERNEQTETSEVNIDGNPPGSLLDRLKEII